MNLQKLSQALLKILYHSTLNIQMSNLPICKQHSLNSFDYISLAESKKQSCEHVQESRFFLNFNKLDLCHLNIH